VLAQATDLGDLYHVGWRIEEDVINWNGQSQPKKCGARARARMGDSDALLRIHTVPWSELLPAVSEMIHDHDAVEISRKVAWRMATTYANGWVLAERACRELLVHAAKERNTDSAIIKIALTVFFTCWLGSAPTPDSWLANLGSGKRQKAGHPGERQAPQPWVQLMVFALGHSEEGKEGQAPDLSQDLLSEDLEATRAHTWCTFLQFLDSDDATPSLPGLLEAGLVVCQVDAVREGFAILLHVAIKQLHWWAPFELASEVMDKFVDGLKGLIPSVSRHWRHLAQYGLVIESAASTRWWLGLMVERDMLAYLLHLYLGPLSPARVCRAAPRNAPLRKYGDHVFSKLPSCMTLGTPELLLLVEGEECFEESFMIENTFYSKQRPTDPASWCARTALLDSDAMAALLRNEAALLRGLAMLYSFAASRCDPAQKDLKPIELTSQMVEQSRAQLTKKLLETDPMSGISEHAGPLIVQILCGLQEAKLLEDPNANEAAEWGESFILGLCPYMCPSTCPYLCPYLCPYMYPYMCPSREPERHGLICRNQRPGTRTAVAECAGLGASPLLGPPEAPTIPHTRANVSFAAQMYRRAE